MSDGPRPIIGLTTDNRDNVAGGDRPKYESPLAYSRAVATVGGLPLLLPQEVACVEGYIARCDGFLLTGGDDPMMELLGRATHPQAVPIAPRRQAFEMALLAALARRPDKPVLGVCLGMQMMALHVGGDLHQHLPDVLGEQAAALHAGRRRHVIHVTQPRCGPAGWAGGGQCAVVSSHHQAVSRPGRMRVVARAADGVIEAIDDPSRRFFVGVQWHPELAGDGPLGLGLITALVRAAQSAPGGVSGRPVP